MPLAVPDTEGQNAIGVVPAEVRDHATVVRMNPRGAELNNREFPLHLLMIRAEGNQVLVHRGFEWRVESGQCCDRIIRPDRTIEVDDEDFLLLDTLLLVDYDRSVLGRDPRVEPVARQLLDSLSEIVAVTNGDAVERDGRGRERRFFRFDLLVDILGDAAPHFGVVDQGLQVVPGDEGLLPVFGLIPLQKLEDLV